MAQFKQWFEQDFTDDIVVRHCESVMFTGDDKGAVVGVRLYDNGTPYSGGGGVAGAVKRSDGGLVALTGTISGNAASVTIPAAALAYPGPIGIRVVLTQGGSTTTVLKVIYSVDDNAGTPVDPGNIVPSYEELLGEIDAMRTATAAANTAANNANTAAANVENNYNALKNVIGFGRKTPDATANDYSLSNTGYSHYEQGYHLVKYQVTPGEKVFIVCEAPVSWRGAYQFQDVSSVSQTDNSHRIGDTVSVATSSEITVPAGASWLIFSERDGYSGNGIYTADIVERVEGLEYIAGKFLVQAVTPFQVVTGWKLIGDGRCEANSGYKLVKYRTYPGNEYYLRGYSTGDILYQFQEDYGVPTSSSVAIGTPEKSSVEGIVSAPANGYYLIMSVPVGDTVSGMYNLIDKDTLIPGYWEDYLTETALPKIYANNLSVGNHGVSFVFFTDQHTNMKCGNLINRVCDAVAGDLLVNGGDVITGSADKAAEIATIRRLMKAIPNHKQFVVHGNHDGNRNYGGSTEANAISDAEFYALCLKPVEEKITSDGRLYYYLDNKNQKVRYIILDTGEPDSAVIDDPQIAWMTARITELTSEWTAVIFAHQVYTSIDNIDPSGTKIINALNALLTGAKIACIISGHAHHDQDYMVDNKYPIIVTTALNAWNESTTQGTPLTRTWGTVTEFAFDVFHIDTANRQIKVTRIGAGSDRTFSYV